MRAFTCYVRAVTLKSRDKNTLVSSDDSANKVEEEEQARYQQYLKAYSSGNETETLSDQEIAEAEEAMAAIYPLGDPGQPFPDNETALDARLCGVHSKREKIIQRYVRRKYPSHLMIQVAVRLSLHALAKKNAEYCQNPKSRKLFIEMAKVINKSIEKTKVPRNTLISSFRAVMYDQPTKSKLGTICCSYWIFKKESVKALPHKQVKKFFKDMLTAYNGNREYLCFNYGEDSHRCSGIDIPLPPDGAADDKRFASVYSSAVEALSKVNSFERK